MSTISMYWWRERPNFGDALAPVIVGAISGRNPVWRHQPPRLLAIGSIIHHALPGDTIWGSGVHNLRLNRPWSPEGKTFLAVRGPITRQYILDRGGACPPVYGDPASLLPRFHPIRVEPIREVALMPHLADATGREFARRHRLPCIDPSQPWQKVVAEIASCRLLLSSSLHGIIVAEAYGVPAIWTAYTKSPEKFHDYYQATGRRHCEPIPWEVAIHAKPPELPERTTDQDLEASLREWLDCNERNKP